MLLVSGQSVDPRAAFFLPRRGLSAGRGMVSGLCFWSVVSLFSVGKLVVNGDHSVARDLLSVRGRSCRQTKQNTAAQYERNGCHSPDRVLD